MTDRGFSLDDLLNVTHTALRGVEARLVDLVVANLEQKVAGTWTESDDALFAPLTSYVKPAWDLQWAHRAIRMWLVELQPHVVAAEQRLGQRLHKGAPIFNTGLCFFMAGDLARAGQYIAEAGREDERTHGGASRLLLGDGLAEQVLLRPLYGWLAATFGTAYRDATGLELSQDEVRGLVDFLSARNADAVLLIMALHRYVAQVEGPDNAASRLQRVRAFADLLLVFESSLRKWQILPTPPRAELCRRSTELLRPSTPAFDEFNLRLGAYPGVDWEDTAVLDGMVRQEIQRFADVSRRPEKLAVAVFASYRLRNSVMHVLDDQLELFRETTVLEQVVGLALVAIRASRFGAEGGIAGL